MPSCQPGSLLCLLVSQCPYVLLPGWAPSSRSAAQQCWWPLGPLPLLQHGVLAGFGTCSLAACRVWETISHLRDCGEERSKAQAVLVACAVHGTAGTGHPVPQLLCPAGLPSPSGDQLHPNTASSYPAPLPSGLLAVQHKPDPQVSFTVAEGGGGGVSSSRFRFFITLEKALQIHSPTLSCALFSLNF